MTTEECSLVKNGIKKRCYVRKILARSGSRWLCEGFGSFSRLHVIVVFQMGNINSFTAPTRGLRLVAKHLLDLRPKKHISSNQVNFCDENADVYRKWIPPKCHPIVLNRTQGNKVK